MLMLLERRGYNFRAARVSEKEVSQGWKIANTKQCRRTLARAS